ncbi:hypothetical protein [Spongiactinospora sp. TRM90649]|uniref:hypothetical protein n=1 Tax=Spongiactinospora sp. TRM90649 TaxID=3031114 RepID=UPI0023F87A06|nr:hypothetical protein [Spongiactinospora sp. TRM90649]MDF5756548.1 hypothetical protein [Spongiactinospora sp. TRM90649]
MPAMTHALATTATRRLRRPERFATRELAETLLTTLRMVRRAENALLTGPGACEDDVREALIKALRTADWPRGMANGAIEFALAHDDLTMALAMYAYVEGHPHETAQPEPRQFVVTDEQAQAMADAIATAFGAHGTGHEPCVLDPDWDSEPGRVLSWEEGPYRWAWLVPGGGEDTEYGRTVAPIEVPAGLRIEPITHFSVRVLPVA